MDYEDCDFCGDKYTKGELARDEIDSSLLICDNCKDFYNTKFTRSHHYLWIIQFALDKLESQINKNQEELVKLNQFEDYELPYCHYKLESDSREKRIKSIEDFLEQYYAIHKYLKQMYKIARHQDTLSFAEAIANHLKKERR